MNIVIYERDESGEFARLPAGEKPKPKSDRRYHARWREPGGKQKSKSFRTKAEAEAFLTTIEAQKNANAYVDPRAGDRLVSDYMAYFLATEDVAPSTADLHARQSRLYIVPDLGDRTIGSLTPADIRQFTQSITSPAMSHSTYRTLRRVLSRAVEEGIIQRNPAVRLGLKAPERGEIHPLEKDQIDSITVAMVPRFQALVTLLAWRGLRIGEACALRVKDIDLMRGRIHVQRTASEVAGVLSEHATKTRKARTVQLPKFLVEELTVHLEKWSNPKDPEAIVFPTSKGNVLRPNSFRGRYWKDACQDAGVIPVPRVHDLRHTSVALCIKAGMHPMAIQEMLGHSSIMVTMDVYGHLFESLQAASMDALDAAMREPKKEEGRVVQFPTG